MNTVKESSVSDDIIEIILWDLCMVLEDLDNLINSFF